MHQTITWGDVRMREEAPRENKIVNRLIHAIKIVKSYDERINLPHWTILLHIAAAEGINQTDLVARSGIARAQVSRCTMDLADSVRTGDRGFGLITREPDRENFKIIRYHLTTEGKRLIAHIEAALK